MSTETEESLEHSNPISETTLRSSDLSEEVAVPLPVWGKGMDHDDIVLKNNPQYSKPTVGFLERTKLEQNARVWHLWALGVGAVISGDYFAWNTGMQAGFGGFLIATFIVAISYVMLTLCLAEMSSMLPFSGGAYGYARATMGPWLGLLVGLAECLEYIMTVATIVFSMGQIMVVVFNTPDSIQPVFWLICYLVALPIHIWGGLIFWNFVLFITILSLLVLAVFWCGSIYLLNFGDYALDNTQSDGDRWFFDGASGWFGSLPYAIWWFLAIEQVPLAAEDAKEPKKDMPRALLSGMATLLITCFLTLFAVNMIPPGISTLKTAGFALNGGFDAIFGGGVNPRILQALSFTGLAASFFCIIFAYGRQIFSMARSGYYPPFLSYTFTWRQRNTPFVALIVGSLVGYIVILICYFASSNAANVLLYMAVLSALGSYVMQLLSFIVLRVRYDVIKRPFYNYCGIPGAVFAMLIFALVIVTNLVFISDSRYSLAGIGGWYVLSGSYFVVYGRKRLVLSPEEQFALFLVYNVKFQKHVRNRVLHRRR